MDQHIIPKRRLGKTGLEVPIIGFGASPLGGIYQVRNFIRALSGMWDPCCPLTYVDCYGQEPLDESEAIAAVHEAFKLGINFFDTSPYYGDTRSEKV